MLCYGCFCCYTNCVPFASCCIVDFSISNWELVTLAPGSNLDTLTGFINNSEVIATCPDHMHKQLVKLNASSESTEACGM